MDWIRRNWPDLLIGIALVAVIAGIIATLLTGGSFFPLGASQASSNRPEPSTATTFDVGPRPTSDASTTVSDSSEARATPAPVTAPAGDEDEEDVVTVSALPVTGSPASDSTTAPQAAQDGTPETGQSADDGDSVALPDADEAGSYRISVGAFSTEENAGRQAATFRDAGYPVFIGTQGDLSIVLVGPYEELAEAERVAERIRAGGFRIEPVIYRFQDDAESQETPARSPARASAPAPQPTAAQATAGRFLQVGAYGTRESSLPQRERLEGLGFRVTERVESGLVKLLVGPFTGDDMGEARALLDEQGIEHFPR